MPKSLIAQAKKMVPNKAPAAQKKIIQALGERIPSGDVELFDGDLFSDIAQSHWDLAKKRDQSISKIRVYCPYTTKRTLRKTVIDVVSSDMAFLVDSVVAEINRHKLLIDFLIHPVLYGKYNGKGELEDISAKPKEGYQKRSHIHIHISEAIPDEVLRALEDGLRAAVVDVSHANRGWKPMLAKLEDVRHELSSACIKESATVVGRYGSFLEYLAQNNFTLLGYREYAFTGSGKNLKGSAVKGTGLGLLHDDVSPAYISEETERLPRNVQKLPEDLPPVSISKTNRISTVHRRVPMDVIAVKTYDDKGKVKGEKLFIGLFTSVTYSRSVSDIPLLRDRVDDIMAMADLAPNSHDQKAMRHILEKYPRDELFQTPLVELYETVQDILRLHERQRIALFMRRDSFMGYISCLVYIPRERFGTSLRKSIGRILEHELNGQITNFYTSLDDSVFARVMFVIHVDQDNAPEIDEQKIELLLREEAQTWSERLAQALMDKEYSQEDVSALTLKYGEAFSSSYAETYSPDQAIHDIEKMEAVQEVNRLALELYRTDDLEDAQMRLKVYNAGAPVTLSDVLPILEHMSLKAISELPFKVSPRDGDSSIWIHDFLLERPSGKSADCVEGIKDKFETCFDRVWYNQMDSDGLNKLVVRAQMDWQEILILRVYVRYLKQLNYQFGRLYVERALTSHAELAKLLVSLFKALHDPAGGHEDPQKIEAKIYDALKAVESIDHDRIMRSFLTLVKATLRTNFFLDKPYISVKLDSQQITDMPRPRPFREIYVYSSRMEGVHLRGDKIARGGLRWSDRHEDFRTEVLGLMKAQMVKNSVIVPMGSKGGFVVKIKTKTRDEFFEVGVTCYKTFISGLLDITDNQKNGKIIPPKNIVRLDGDDPYLVVAADKGTATFSDIANGIAQDYGFWLDDAFASGGSVGYDHKKMGITARGAWESVKAHFRGLNHDTQAKPFDVVGVGDMGGDVFGNGMLLSEHIRLIGAFNHLHIFCDPDPDIAVSFKERTRLFKAVKGWDEYDESTLSKGGRIFSRHDKVLELTPEIQARFDLDKAKVSPSELMRAIIGARTDLIWFGGIGTYIKSSDETHDDAGDKANDSIRLNAVDVRAKVIGEGANLGVTQLGRIEFARNGGHVNTDFLDNSGGVDSSDHEVNIKILLRDVMQKKKHKMDIAARNKLLEKMTNTVSDHVLLHNYQQSLAISLASLQAPDNVKVHEQFIRELERDIGLDRKLEGLPSSKAMEERKRLGKGLTRPELCVLLSYAKIEFSKDLLASDVPDDPHMQVWLYEYFPEILRDQYKVEIANHQLGREIISTVISSSMVNRMGPTFLRSCMKKTGAVCSEVAKSYMIVRDVFGLFDLWGAIEGMDNKVPALVQLRAMRSIFDLAEHGIIWFLTRLGRDLDLTKDIEAFGSCVQILRDNMDSLLTPELKVSVEQHIEAGKGDGLPECVATDIAHLPILSSACDIIRISLEQGTDLLETAKTYFEVGEAFHLDWLRSQARFMKSDSKWASEARDGMIEALFGAQAGLTMRILRDVSSVKSSAKPESAVVEWLGGHAHLYEQLTPFFEELRLSGNIDLSMLMIADQRLRNLYGG